jgi:ABC-type transport system involved in multi-copper enzyme maturation permease subunit
MPAINPILTRELKERMRTLRAPVVLTLYLLVLGMVAFATEHYLTRGGGFDPFEAAGLGRAVFQFLLFFTLLLICFLVPGFTSASVSGEREKQTLGLLQVTLLRPRSIVLGKLGSSMAFLMLLIVATLPLMSVSFVLGGVTPLDVLRGYGMVVLTGFTIAMVGIGLSSMTRKTVSATLLVYTLVGILTLGTIASYGLMRFVAQRGGRDGSGHVWALVLNPFVGTASAIRGTGATGGPSTPFNGLFDFLAPRSVSVTTFSGSAFAVPAVGPVPRVLQGGGSIPLPGPDPRFGPVNRPPHRLPVWASTIGWYLALAVGGYALAIVGVRAPSTGMRFRIRRRSIAEES